jgi:predicted RNA methylase
MAATEAREVWSIDVRTGVDQWPELTQRVFAKVLSSLPRELGVRLAPIHFLRADVRHPESMRRLRGRKFTKIIADPPFGWASRESESEAIQTFLSSFRMVANHLAPEASAYCVTPRFWLMRDDVKRRLRSWGLCIARERAIPEGSVLALIEVRRATAA